MSKYVLSLALILCSFFGAKAFAEDIQLTEPQLWEVLHSGDWSLSQKMVLVRPINSTNDQLMSTFMLAYARYRSGNENEALQLLKSIDGYVETVYLPAGN